MVGMRNDVMCLVQNVVYFWYFKDIVSVLDKSIELQSSVVDGVLVNFLIV